LVALVLKYELTRDGNIRQGENKLCVKLWLAFNCFLLVDLTLNRILWTNLRDLVIAEKQMLFFKRSFTVIYSRLL